MSQQQKQKTKRRLHTKHKNRRKKDCMIGMPFIIGYQGDPARGYYFRCNDMQRMYKNRLDYHYHLINPLTEKPFSRLKRYQKKRISDIAKIGYILVEEAPSFKYRNSH